MSLEQWRIIYDMIETFKILNGFNNTDTSNWFSIIPATARATRNNTGYMNLVSTNQGNLFFRACSTSMELHTR